jgi:hypothetical protein
MNLGDEPGFPFDILWSPIEMSALTSHVSKIRRKYPEQQHFHVMYQVLVLEDVPAKMIPGISPSVARGCVPESLSNISLSDVNRCRAVIQDVNALPTPAAPWHVFDVVSVSHPQLAEFVYQYHRSLH